MRAAILGCAPSAQRGGHAVSAQGLLSCESRRAHLRRNGEGRTSTQPRKRARDDAEAAWLLVRARESGAGEGVRGWGGLPSKVIQARQVRARTIATKHAAARRTPHTAHTPCRPCQTRCRRSTRTVPRRTPAQSKSSPGTGARTRRAQAAHEATRPSVQPESLVQPRPCSTPRNSRPLHARRRRPAAAAARARAANGGRQARWLGNQTPTWRRLVPFFRCVRGWRARVQLACPFPVVNKAR